MKNGQLLWKGDGKKLYVYQFGQLDTNTGVFVNEDSGEAFVIDAPSGSYEYLKGSILADSRVVSLLITHGHWDHIGDDFLFKKDGAKIYVHEGDRVMLEHPETMLRYTVVTVDLHPCQPDHMIEDGEVFDGAGMEIRAHWVPGHSPGGVAFYLAWAGIAFVGDTLFKDGIGRYDLLGGHKQSLISCIKEKILTLPHGTVIVPGHGPFTRVEYELSNNRYLH